MRQNPCDFILLHFFIFLFLIRQLIYRRILVHVRWWSRYYASNERREVKNFGRINRNPLCLELRQTRLCTALFACPCTTKCRESESSPYPRVGRGLAPTGDCTTNCAQQEWVDASIPHPPLTERRQPCQSRAIKIVGISRTWATRGAGAMDNPAWNDPAQWHPCLSPDNQHLRQLWD